MATKFYDYFYLDNYFQGKNGDFSGREDAFSPARQVEFLENYADFLESKNNVFAKPRKVVTPKEIEETAKKINYTLLGNIRKRVILNQFRLSTEEYRSGYAGWKFYAGARMGNGRVYLEDKNIPPVANAKYSFEKGAKSIEFSVYLPATFYNKAKKNGLVTKISVTTIGRSIELRSGIGEVAKIQFYANGQVYIREGRTDPYHSTDTYIADFVADSWNSVKILLNESSFRLIFNGVEYPTEFAYTSDLLPDTLFVSGGIRPSGSWGVKMERLCYSDKEIFNFDERETDGGAVCDCNETVDLPYRLGLEENKDKTIILTKNFRYEGGRLRLHIGSIDPCGEIYINGKKLCQVDNFLCVEKDITDFVSVGENTLTIKVYPRAPEVLYVWHRHKDPYNAWFCRDVYLDYLADSNIQNVKVKTVSVENAVKANISFTVENVSKGASVAVYLRKTYPETGEEILLCEEAVNGSFFEKTLCFNAELWSVDEPNLYGVRAVLKVNGKEIDDEITETGFRTIKQKDGDIFLNGKKVCLYGGLIMQFLPPYSDIPLNHLCPSYSEIVSQILSVKKMNGNTARLHILGYGTNDPRFASVCDRLGIMLIWTTRLIDSLETMEIDDKWLQKDAYISQMQEVLNHPSIVVWEGSNEYHASRFDFDSVFDEFVSAVKACDDTRLICPVSHVYYGGQLGDEGFYYQDDGEFDLYFEKKKSSFGWKDDLVIRSAHPYVLLLGYGRDWTAFRKQNWDAQDALLNSKKHAYIISEFAVIGRQDGATEECAAYIKTDSYELANEETVFQENYGLIDAKKSQAYQALCALNAVKYMRLKGVDGMLWCAMQGGANDGSYLKPPIDFYGYAKYAFYALKEGFAKTVCFNSKVDLLVGKNYKIEPFVTGLEQGKKYTVTVTVRNGLGDVVILKKYDGVQSESERAYLQPFALSGLKDGYYSVEYQVN